MSDTWSFHDGDDNLILLFIICESSLKEKATVLVSTINLHNEITTTSGVIGHQMRIRMFHLV